MLDLLSAPVRAAAPTFEPVTLAEAKKHAEVPQEDTYHDEQLLDLITFAREQVEHDTGLVCTTGSFVWKLRQWPADGMIEIPLRPVTGVTISYVDIAGATQALDSSNFTLVSGTTKPTIMLAYNASWPTHRGHHQDITLTITAGHATTFMVPKMVKQAVLMEVVRRFGDREGMEQVNQPATRAYEMLIRRLSRSTYP